MSLTGPTLVLLRQPLVGAVEPLGKALAVGQVRLKDLADLAQDPVDLLLLGARLSTGARTARGSARRRP